MTETTEQMKDWQFGYPLDFLKEIENFYSYYNSFSASPFAKYKKNDIAKDLHEQCHMALEKDGVVHTRYVRKITKVRTPITLYDGVTIGIKEPGDVTITKLAGDAYEGFKGVLDAYKGENVWVYVWAEDRLWPSLMTHNGFSYIGSKVTTFGEIYNIYFRDSNRSFFGNREHPYVNPIEFVTLKKIGNVSKELIEGVADKLNMLSLDYTNHYSNYNKDNSWSALSLRGYSPDYTFINKPSEMNKKWQAKHVDETFIMQDTPLYKHFPEIKQMLSDLFDGAIHRVRFMQLAPGGGELERHTDQVDDSAGYGKGQLMRFHFPIKTNTNMKFSAWDLMGNLLEYHMQVGEFWILDTRKPHRAINNGNEPRIHLVVDVEMTKQTEQLIMR